MKAYPKSEDAILADEVYNRLINDPKFQKQCAREKLNTLDIYELIDLGYEWEI